MEVLRNEFCDRHKIPWYQKCFLKDARTLWICALNYEDWTYVDKLLEMFPEALKEELDQLSWGIFTRVTNDNINLIRIMIVHLSKSNNIYSLQRAVELLLNLYLHRDHQSIRTLYRFYKSIEKDIDYILSEIHKLARLYYNIYAQIFLGRCLSKHLTRLFDSCQFNQNMRQALNRFVNMCIIFNRCDVIENIYQCMKNIEVNPPLHTIAFVRHSACVIQRRWRSYFSKKEKQKIARLCYGLGLSGNVAFVIYKHSGLENSYKKI